MEEISQAFRLGGGWGNVSGPGLAMIRGITSCIISSVFMGMTGASIGALVWDTAAMPFLASACAGFVMGAIGFYRDVLRKSLRALDRYPQLIKLHLDANFSHRGFDEWSLGQLRSPIFRSSWRLQSMLIVAWMSASPTIDRIREAKEDAMVSKAGEERDADEK